MFMTMPGFVILLLFGLLGVWLYAELGSYPGKVARRRGHPQADAINVLGWLGPLAGGLGWLVALVWANTTPPGGLYAAGRAHKPATESPPEEADPREEDGT
jgi:hypothetical protein